MRQAVNGIRCRIPGFSSDVEAEVQDIAFLNAVFLALQPQAAGVAGTGFAPVFQEIS